MWPLGRRRDRSSSRPFLTPGAQRQRASQLWRASWRASGLRALGAIGASAAALAAGVLAAHLATARVSARDAGGATSGGTTAAGATAGGAAGGQARTHRGFRLTVAPRRSVTGLPLRAPALTLGVGNAAADPVRPGFVHPPRGGLLFNLETGRVLWQVRPHRRLPIASLTKMMTAYIAASTDPPDAKVLITRQAVRMPGSKVGELPLGKRVDLEPLLYGLMLPSGNDAAVAIAQHVSGRVPAFVKLMNAEAAKLGLSCTRYSSPSGYYDADNFSCATDLAVLAYDDLSIPLLARIVATRYAVIPFPIKHGKLYLSNNNPLLLYGYPKTTGLKTGYTEAAGTCLVGTARRDGVELGVVLLHSPAPGTQAAKLLDEGFEDVYHESPVHSPPIPGGA